MGKNNIKPKILKIKNVLYCLYVKVCDMVIAIKLARQPESLVGLSDLGFPLHLALPDYLVWPGTAEPCRYIDRMRMEWVRRHTQ